MIAARREWSCPLVLLPLTYVSQEPALECLNGSGPKGPSLQFTTCNWYSSLLAVSLKLSSRQNQFGLSFESDIVIKCIKQPLCSSRRRVRLGRVLHCLR